MALVFGAFAGDAAAAKKKSRRARLVGRVVAESDLRREPVPRPSGNLHIYSTNSHEELKINIFNSDGSYNVESLSALAHLLRCRRTGEERPIEPRLLSVLSNVYDHFGDRRIEVLSAFRYQRRKSSYHYKGTASDVRIIGVSATRLRAFVHSLDTGGMGLGIYPRTGFVHVDIRPLPSYRWIDYSRSDPNSADKRPPRGWRKKKLQS